MDHARQPSRAEQRMAAVAKLKRAASLPRMKDGRRPPMHTDAVSEGEKATNGDDAKGDVSPSQEPREHEEVEEDTVEPDSHPEPVAEVEVEVEVQAEVGVEVEPEVEAEPEADVEDMERAVSPSPAARSKRRSRSRSRSRGSKDLRGKARTTQSPTPTPPAAGDSSQDESSFPPPLNLAALAPLMSPIPSHILELQRSRLLRSPTPTQDPSMLSSGLSPHSPVLPPSLEALQRGLLRSNSAGNAAGRIMALHKLTGGTESYDPIGSSSPSSSPFGKLSRSNTVTGGERTAARQLMLSRLGGRIGKETDGELASGGEERSAPSPTPKRRRRRSRRGSQGANTGVSDSEFLSTSPNTPSSIPQVPLPSAFDALSELLLRSRSVTPFQYITPPAYEVEQGPEPPQPVQVPERHERTRRRSVVVEEEDEDERYPPQRTHPAYSGPQPHHTPALRLPHPSDAPSNASSDSASPLGSVALYISQRTPNRTPHGNDAFPRSPYAAPLTEAPSREDDEEQVLYQPDTLRSRTPYDPYEENSEREISWVASPVPELDSMPISVEDEDEGTHDRDEEEDQDLEELPISPGSSNNYLQQEQEVYDDSPRVSSSSKSLVVESETSPSHVSLAISGAAASQTASFTPASDASTSPQTYPMRLSVASRSPLYGEFPDWEDRAGNTDPSAKRNGDSPSTWEKVKSTFSRAGSSAGRRSRTNSIVTRERRERADSINRESGASLNSAKTDRLDPFTVAQSPSASASISSLTPPLASGPRGGPSPIPPLNPVNKSKYQHAKLFPFGMTTAPAEQRSRIPSASASSPDIVLQSSSNEEDVASLSVSTTGHTPEIMRERKLSHQTSDTHLMARFNPAGPSSHPDGPPRSPGGSYKLPMTLSAVKQWLNRKQSSAPPVAAPVPIPRPHTPSQKLVAPDVMRRQESQQSADWEQVTPTSPVGDSLLRPGQNGNREVPSTTNPTTRSEHTDTEKTPKAKKMKMTLPPSDQSDNGIPFFDDSPLSPPLRPDPFSSTTPDPSSSLSDYPAHSTSESSSTTSSQYSLGPLGPQGPLLLQKFDEELARSHSRIWAISTDSPRKLLLSTPAFQVVNHNTVKDRFLFLFSDILVIAKPVFTDQETRILHDRKFTVKSVVQLSQLRFTDGRAETGAKETDGSKTRNRIASFVHNFSKDPDGAINSLYVRSGHGEDAAAAGQLLFKTLDLDRVRLGEYLARRTSKAVLKVYLDSFRFYGLRVDHALRVFLLSIHIPSHYQHNGHNGLEYLLETFAGRWYEANARLVDYNKDHAHRFVRAIVQLNNSLHGEIANEPGFTETRRDVTSDDFIVAFRRYDQKSSVSDGLLQDVYESILNERLSHSPNTGSPVESIAMKRVIPTSLTWRIDSDPIIFRIPQADPGLSIELYGQDMIFDPPVLNFGKSSEVSFRVKALTLGPKSIIMRRSGPNAIKYTGLPLSCPVLVERAFMRHTIQVAFQNHNGLKRKYMFGMDDSVVRYQWVAHMQKQIEKATEASKSGASIFQRAAEVLAFRVLQESLLASPPVNPPNKTSQRTNAHPHLGPRFLHARTAAGSNQLTSLHVRSKSRSKVYHRHGAGKNELDLSQPISHRGSHDEYDERPDVSQGPLWSFEDLKILCTKNGSIPAVLSDLQAPSSEQSSGL